jgi:predicted membrane protein
MKSLTAHERSLAGLARSVRAAIVVPPLFASALFLFKQPELAGFAVFGTFAHQVLVNYEPAGTARFTQSAMLTLLGAIMLSLGTLASPTVWFAVTGTVMVGFLSELPTLADGRISAIRRALVLTFLLAVAVPAPAPYLFSYLAGWLMAGVIAQPALLLIWIPLQGSSAIAEGASSCDLAAGAVAPGDLSNWMEKAVRSGLVLGLAILLARLLKAEHAFWVVLGVIPVLSAGEGSAARTFWHEQVGTLIGFLVSAVVAAIIGQHEAWYWLILPLVVFSSSYAASAVGLMAGQAAFTLFAVVLFCILLPRQTQTGMLRLEDIAIGGAVSLVVGSLLRLGENRSVNRLRRAAAA